MPSVSSNIINNTSKEALLPGKACTTTFHNQILPVLHLALRLLEGCSRVDSGGRCRHIKVQASIDLAIRIGRDRHHQAHRARRLQMPQLGQRMLENRGQTTEVAGEGLTGVFTLTRAMGRRGVEGYMM